MIKRYREDEIDKLAQILKQDGVISVPTDTVYGICARTNSINAYNKLILVKNRPITKPFPIMCADEEQIKSIAIVSDKTEKLIHTLMPGPITLVLQKKSEVPEYISNGKTTIAVRMATSNVLKNLIQKVGSPIFMTSANQSGEQTATNLDEIEKSCPLLDGMMVGKISFGRESTIIDCTLDEFKILRSGPITVKDIMKCLE